MYVLVKCGFEQEFFKETHLHEISKVLLARIENVITSLGRSLTFPRFFAALGLVFNAKMHFCTFLMIYKKIFWEKLDFQHISTLACIWQDTSVPYSSMCPMCNAWCMACVSGLVCCGQWMPASD